MIITHRSNPGHGGPIWTASWLARGQREKEGEQAETDGQIDRGGHDWAVSVCGEWGPVGTTWIMAPVERGGDQINNSPEEGEEWERERGWREDTGGVHHWTTLTPSMLTFLFFSLLHLLLLSQAVQLMRWAWAQVNVLGENRNIGRCRQCANVWVWLIDYSNEVMFMVIFCTDISLQQTPWPALNLMKHS